MPKDITVDGVTMTIPDYADVVDGEVAFSSFGEDLAAVLATKIPRTNGTVATASASSAVVRNIHLSTGDPVPADGMDGDVWFKYV